MLGMTSLGMNVSHGSALVDFVSTLPFVDGDRLGVMGESLQGLLTPRPLLVDIGMYDEVFRAESALACHRQLREIYAAAGAEKQLELELAPSDHGWHEGRKSLDFFTTYLEAV
jgi:hypothetical protein